MVCKKYVGHLFEMDWQLALASTMQQYIAVFLVHGKVWNGNYWIISVWTAALYCWVKSKKNICQQSNFAPRQELWDMRHAAQVHLHSLLCWFCLSSFVLSVLVLLFPVRLPLTSCLVPVSLHLVSMFQVTTGKHSVWETVCSYKVSVI